MGHRIKWWRSPLDPSYLCGPNPPLPSSAPNSPTPKITYHWPALLKPLLVLLIHIVSILPCPVLSLPPPPQNHLLLSDVAGALAGCHLCAEVQRQLVLAQCGCAFLSWCHKRVLGHVHDRASGTLIPLVTERSGPGSKSPQWQSDPLLQ